jgi:hypothetical protein
LSARIRAPRTPSMLPAHSSTRISISPQLSLRFAA